MRSFATVVFLEAVALAYRYARARFSSVGSCDLWLRAGELAFSERNTQDGELERLRDYAVSIHLREVAIEKKLNGERQKVASFEAELIEARQHMRS